MDLLEYCVQYVTDNENTSLYDFWKNLECCTQFLTEAESKETVWSTLIKCRKIYLFSEERHRNLGLTNKLFSSVAGILDEKKILLSINQFRAKMGKRTIQLQERKENIVKLLQQYRIFHSDAFLLKLLQDYYNATKKYDCEQVNQKTFKQTLLRLKNEKKLKKIPITVHHGGFQLAVEAIASCDVTEDEVGQLREELIFRLATDDNRHRTKESATDDVDEEETRRQQKEEDNKLAVNTLKFHRARIIHEYLWKASVGNVPPGHSGRILKYPVIHSSEHSWMKLLDLAFNIPLQVLLNFYQPPISSEMMKNIEENFMNGDVLVRHLPEEIRHPLIYDRRYLQAFHKVLKYLCFMKIISFVPHRGINFADRMIVLRNKLTILDTRTSKQGFLHISKDVKYQQVKFNIKSIHGLNEYWDKLKELSLATPLGHKGLKTAKEQDRRPQQSLNQFITQHLKRKHVDDENQFGDGLGACGFDSSLHLHRRSNWFPIITFTSVQDQEQAAKTTVAEPQADEHTAENFVVVKVENKNRNEAVKGGRGYKRKATGETPKKATKATGETPKKATKATGEKPKNTKKAAKKPRLQEKVETKLEKMETKLKKIKIKNDEEKEVGAKKRRIFSKLEDVFLVYSYITSLFIQRLRGATYGMARHLITWETMLKLMTEKIQQKTEKRPYNLRQRLDILVKNEQNHLYIRTVLGTLLRDSDDGIVKIARLDARLREDLRSRDRLLCVGEIHAGIPQIAIPDRRQEKLEEKYDVICTSADVIGRWEQKMLMSTWMGEGERHLTEIGILENLFISLLSQKQEKSEQACEALSTFGQDSLVAVWDDFKRQGFIPQRQRANTQAPVQFPIFSTFGTRRMEILTREIQQHSSVKTTKLNGGFVARYLICVVGAKLKLPVVLREPVRELMTSSSSSSTSNYDDDVTAARAFATAAGRCLATTVHHDGDDVSSEMRDVIEGLACTRFGSERIDGCDCDVITEAILKAVAASGEKGICPDILLAKLSGYKDGDRVGMQRGIDSLLRHNRMYMVGINKRKLVARKHASKWFIKVGAKEEDYFMIRSWCDVSGGVIVNNVIKYHTAVFDYVFRKPMCLVDSLVENFRVVQRVVLVQIIENLEKLQCFRRRKSKVENSWNFFDDVTVDEKEYLFVPIDGILKFSQFLARVQNIADGS